MPEIRLVDAGRVVEELISILCDARFASDTYDAYLRHEISLSIGTVRTLLGDNRESIYSSNGDKAITRWLREIHHELFLLSAILLGEYDGVRIEVSYDFETVYKRTQVWYSKIRQRLERKATPVEHDTPDTKPDTTKKTPRKKRPMNAQVGECVAEFRKQRKSDPTVTMTQIVDEYCESDPVARKPKSIMRTLSDHSELWKDGE